MSTKTHLLRLCMSLSLILPKTRRDVWDRKKSQQQQQPRQATVTSYWGLTLTPAHLPTSGRPGLCQRQTSARLKGERETGVVMPAGRTWGGNHRARWQRLGMPRGSAVPTIAHRSTHRLVTHTQPPRDLSPQPCSPPLTAAALQRSCSSFLLLSMQNQARYSTGLKQITNTKHRARVCGKSRVNQQ